MNYMSIVLVVAAVVVLPVVLIAALLRRNGTKKLTQVQEAWRQVEVELDRRYDVVPKLMALVRREIPEAAQTVTARVEETLAQARRRDEDSSFRTRVMHERHAGVGPVEQAQRENALSAALEDLFKLTDEYGAVRNSEEFQVLQAQLTNTEDRIAAGRRYYNTQVKDAHALAKKAVYGWPMIAGPLGQTELFESTDPAVRAAPNATFAQQRDMRESTNGR